MNRKQSTAKGGTKGKAEGSKGTELTPERIHTILADPGVRRGVKGKLEKLVGEFYAAADASTLPDSPALTAAMFDAADSVLYYSEKRGEATDEARAALSKLVAFVGEHEPESHRLARRVSELINSGVDGSIEVSEWFMQLTNDIGVSLENEDFCAAAFVKAARRVEATKPVRRITTKNVMLHGAQKAYEQLKEIVRRVDAGEALAQIQAERQAAISEALRDGEADELKRKRKTAKK